MKISFKLVTSHTKNDDLVFLIDNKVILSKLPLQSNEVKFAKSEMDKGNPRIVINKFNQRLFIIVLPRHSKSKGPEATYDHSNTIRDSGVKLLSLVNKFKIDSLIIFNKTSYENAALLCAEGIGLGNYQFLKYKSKKGKEKEENSLKKVCIFKDSGARTNVSRLQVLIDSVNLSKDLVNEPVSYLSAAQLAKEFQAVGKRSNIKVEVFNHAKIRALKMGGLLAVNQGSVNPPKFIVAEWKPRNAKNKSPIVLIGKGIVYDTGGLSLKPTPNSMDIMKSDMAGAAAVIGSMNAAAKSKLPLHIIGLIPATDNWPGQNAYAPGDIISMHDGSTVEVMNTDAEGRIILADALSYAKKYNPELVIDLATLTGAAARAIGPLGVVYMGTANDKTKQEMKISGDMVHERLVEFPLWKEYREMLKSDIADIRNIGGDSAGAITAGIFLKHFY